MDSKDASVRRNLRLRGVHVAVGTGLASGLFSLIAVGVPLSVASAQGFSSTGPAAPSVSATEAAAVPAGQGWIRFGHFSPSQGAVSVYLDGKLLIANAAFESVTPYQSVTAGTHVLTVTSAGATTTLVSTTVTVPAGGAVTSTALQGPSGLILSWFTDDLSAAPAGEAKVRVIDTAPAQGTVSAQLSASATADAFSSASTSAAVPAVTINSTPFGEASPYVDLPSGTCKVNVDGASGSAIVTGTSWPVAAGTVASVVVLQSATGPTLEVLADAAGSTSAPVGGMQTGFGGAAALLNPSPGGGVAEPLTIGLLVTAGLVAAGSLTLRRRRSAPLA